MRYAVVRDFMGEIEVEETYDTREEAQDHINKAIQTESAIAISTFPLITNFTIKEVEE